jgi:hypothetical protein
LFSIHLNKQEHTTKMFIRLLTRALAAILPREDYLLPRWNPQPIQQQIVTPLREIVIHSGQGRFAHIITLV